MRIPGSLDHERRSFLKSAFIATGRGGGAHRWCGGHGRARGGAAMPPHADVLQWEHLPFPKSLPDFQRLFHDDDACARYLEGAKWPKGFVCPYCSEKGEPFRMTTLSLPETLSG